MISNQKIQTINTHTAPLLVIPVTRQCAKAKMKDGTTQNNGRKLGNDRAGWAVYSIYFLLFPVQCVSWGGARAVPQYRNATDDARPEQTTLWRTLYSTLAAIVRWVCRFFALQSVGNAVT